MGVILCDTEADWELRLFQEIDRYIFNRPVLVFFEDLATLQRMYKSKRVQVSPDLLHEGVPQQHRAAVISRAMAGSDGSSSYHCTFLTRAFGRGTDFMCYDENANLAGGVHVIQTFVSREISEEVQIQGRTARQDREGTFSMVLFVPHLERLHISATDVARMRDAILPLYDTINRRRCELFDRTYGKLKQRVTQSEAEHQQSLEFVKNLHLAASGRGSGPVAAQQAWESCHEFLLDHNICREDPKGNAEGRHIILLDGTESMGELLDLVKANLSHVFRRTFPIIQKHLGDTKTFQIQIGVYRNYHVPKVESLLEVTDFHAEAQPLIDFLDGIVTSGGWGREAVELGLSHVLRVHDRLPVGQIIVIGDAPPNTRWDTDYKRKKCTLDLTRTPHFSTPTYFDEEHARVKFHERIQVSTVFLPTAAADAVWIHDFKAMACNGGFQEDLDVRSDRAGDQLTNIISTSILKMLGGQKLVDDYDSQPGYR